jgi:hypothetical protein
LSFATALERLPSFHCLLQILKQKVTNDPDKLIDTPNHTPPMRVFECAGTRISFG